MITIRLKPTGTKSRKQWRIVVTQKEAARDSRFLEEIGHYNPLVEPPAVKIRKDRYEAWLAKGARPTPTVKQIIRQTQKLKNAD